MRRFMISAAAAALLAPAAFAQTGAQTDARNDKAAEVEVETKVNVDGETKAKTKTKSKTHAAADAQMTDASGVVYLEARQISAKDLLGEEIQGTDGEQVAHIDDLVINADGKAETVVFKSGGVFGLGGKRGALEFGKVNVAIDEDIEPRVEVSMSDEAVKSVAEFKTERMNDYRLASELIGASAQLSTSDKEATITDLILAEDGSIEHVIVQDGIIGAVGGEKRVVAYNKVAIEQGDGGGVVLDVTPDALETLPRFAYEAEAEAMDDTVDQLPDAR